MPSPFTDPNLQWLQITDFTPGIFRYKRGQSLLAYSLGAPPGSCSNSYRCIARQGVGLVPLPNYIVCQTHTASDPSNPVCLSHGSMLALSPRGGVVGDLVTTVLTQVGHPEVTTKFDVTRFCTFAPSSPPAGDPTTPLSVYSSQQTALVGPAPGYAWPFNTLSWPPIDYAVWQDPNTHIYGRTALTHDPITTSITTNPSGPGKWITVPSWLTPGVLTVVQSANGTFPIIPCGIGSYPFTFYHTYRMGVFQTGDRAVNGQPVWLASDDAVLETSDQLAPTNLTNPTTSPFGATTFFPEMGTAINCWGSISTGELVVIYEEGGAALVYGDMAAPTQVFKLPGVAGAAAVGKGALTYNGLMYVGSDGVYNWNGDNASVKVSTQIPDDVFTRTHQANGFSSSPAVQTDTHVWGPWVTFPNNWVYDTLTQSWWQLEDPGVINFQVFAGTGGSLFASPGIAYANAGATATLNTYLFSTAGASQSSYFWLSSPLPITQSALVNIQMVEIVASNPTTSPCTIVVDPGVPSGQIPLPQQNPNQSVSFTIPPQTVGYRASQRLGYADYNVQLAVTASNNNTALQAPILHELNVGWTETRSAGVTS